MLDLPHYFHSAPLVHLTRQHVLIWIAILVFTLQQGLLQKVSCYGLATDIGPDYALAVDESLDYWHHVGVLGPDVYHQGTLEAEEVGWEDRRFVHKDAIELVLLEKQFD